MNIFEAAEKEAEDSGLTFPDGSKIGEWVVICTICHQCGRNPEFLVCPTCKGNRIKTVDFLRGKK
jgi:hypothetical protein